MAAKNDILRDKNGNQIFPATTAEQVSYDGKINVKQAIKRGAVRNKVAPTVASMTDKEQIYVYTGTEDGYTFGNWYYWDGTAWTSGGAYNAIEVNTDGTLTEEGAPADAKATGDKLSKLKDDLIKETNNRNKAVNAEKERAIARENEIEELFTMPTEEAINKWLDEHPEATTTVQDHSLTIDKMVVGTLGFVTPEMFGAVGDGATVDNTALNECFAFCVSHGIPCYGEGKTYLVDDSTGSLANHFGLVVNGGITIKDFHFKLKSGCPDRTVLLACKYNSNPYLVENCIFEGELRTISSGAEDGGNHGIIFCDGVNMFPSDWQTFADITVRNCDFINIQSYGIFPTPINNKLTVENCNFSCHACGILTYATDSIVTDCTYTYLSGPKNTTIRTLAIDEIENFLSVTAHKKNLSIINCNSSNTIYQLQHNPQEGVTYEKILIQGCNAGADIIHAHNNKDNYSIDADITIRDCYTSMAVGRQNANGLLLSHLSGNVVIDNYSCNENSNPVIRIRGEGSIIFRNCDINFSTIFSGSSILKSLILENCKFVDMHSDFAPNGYITSRYSTVPTIDYVEIENCRVETGARLLYGIDADDVYVNGLNAKTGINLEILFNETAFDTNVYVDGLIMPTKNSDWSYLIENITGKAVIRGMSAGINTSGVAGGVTKEITTIS